MKFNMFGLTHRMNKLGFIGLAVCICCKFQQQSRGGLIEPITGYPLQTIAYARKPLFEVEVREHELPECTCFAPYNGTGPFIRSVKYYSHLISVRPL